MRRTINSEMTKAPIKIGSKVSIHEVREVMQIWGMRHLPVIGDDNQLIGIVSDRDFGKLYGSNLTGKDPITEIMTENPYFVFSDAVLADVVQSMAESKYGSVIITNLQREVIGIFTTTDAMNILAKLLRESGNDGFKVLKMSDYVSHFHSA